MTTSNTTMDLITTFLGAFEGTDRPQGTEREAWIEMWREDAVWECPLMPTPYRLESRDKISTFMLWMMDASPDYQIISKTIFPSANPDEAFAEVRGDGPVDGGGRYTQHYLVHFETSDGKISRVREFLNPIAVFNAFGEDRINAAFESF